MKRYDWILFDSTGTLMTPDPEPAQIYHDVGSRFGITTPIDQIRINLKAAMFRHFFADTANRPTDETAERKRWQCIVTDTLPDLREECFDEVFDTLWHRFADADNWRLFDDVLPSLERLAHQGYAIAIASNFDARLRSVLNGMAVMERFDEVLISSDLGWSKPNTQFYDAIAQRLDVNDRTRMLMIGDTQRGDVDAALAAGLDARLLVRDSKDALGKLTSDL